MIKSRIVVPNRGGVLTPFKIVKINNTTIAFVQGTVNGEIAKLNGTELDANYSVNVETISEAKQYWLKATISDESVTSVDIVSTDPGVDTTSQTSEFLGSVSFVDGKITGVSSNLTKSQSVTACGSSYIWG